MSMSSTPEARVITGTATATPTKRTVTITVTADGVPTEYTDSWASPDLGSAIEFANEVRSVTNNLWGIETDWMVGTKDANTIVLEILDESVFEGAVEEEFEEWLLPDPDYQADENE